MEVQIMLMSVIAVIALLTGIGIIIGLTTKSLKDNQIRLDKKIDDNQIRLENNQITLENKIDQLLINSRKQVE